MAEAAPSRGFLARADRWAASHAGWVTLALFALALLPRMYVALAWAREPVWDGHYYHLGATKIAEGVGYGDDRNGVFRPWCHYPVGYSGFLAAFYALLGPAPAIATAVQAVVGAATVATVHQLALTFLSHRRAIVAALLCAASPNLILYSGLVMTEPLAALGLLLGPLVFAKLERRPLWGALAAGLVLGLTTLVRPQSLLAAPAIALLVPRGSSLGKRAVVAALTTAACVAVVMPWTLRNCEQMDGCAFVSTNAGWNLAIGAHPQATGRFVTLSGDDGCREITGQVDQDRCWARTGVSWIRADPERWLGLAPAKLSYTFDHQSFAVGYLSQAAPEAWPEPRRALYRRVMSIAQYALLLFAALGALVVPREGARGIPLALALSLAPVLFLDGLMREPQRIWPLALLIPVFACVPPFARASGGKVGYLAWSVLTLIAVHVAFFGEDRYQVVITPALALLAGAALRREPAPAPNEVTRAEL